MKKNFKIIFFITVIIATFAFIYLLNYNTEYATDDFVYQYIYESRYPTKTTRLISNPLEIFGSMVNHWKLWGGRVTIHFLLQLVFFVGKEFFNIINSIMFVLLGLLIYLHINNKKLNTPLLITIYAVFFLFVPQPGATILWKSGSANYLWSAVLLLTMTLILKKHFDDKNKIRDNKKNQILLFLYGMFIGCTNENTGCALIVAIVVFMIFYKIKYKEIPKWCYYTLCGTTISYIFLLLSPGNYLRTEEMYPGVKHGILNFADYTLKITKLTNNYIGPILITAFATFVLTFNKKKNLKEFIKTYGLQIAFFIFTFISIYSLVLSPAYPERSWIFAFIYLIIIIGLNINNIKESKYINIVNKVMIIITFSFSLFSISTYSEAIHDLADTKEIVKKNEMQIKKEKKEGIKDIKIYNYPESTNRYNTFTYNGYLSYNKKSWTNRWMAKYYGVSSIIAE